MKSHSISYKCLALSVLTSVTMGSLPSSAKAQTASPPVTAGAQAEGAAIPEIIVVAASRGDQARYKVNQSSSASTSSAAAVLNQVPSISVDPEGRISLRGRDDVVILVDGRPARSFEGEGRGDALLNMPADQIAEIEVMTNPPPEYTSSGGGGVINLITRKPRGEPSFSGVAAIGNDSRYRIALRGQKKLGQIDASGNISFRRDQPGSINDTTRISYIPGDERVLDIFRTNVCGQKRFDVGGQLSHAPSKQSDVRLSVNYWERHGDCYGLARQTEKSLTGSTLVDVVREADPSFDRRKDLHVALSFSNDFDRFGKTSGSFDYSSTRFAGFDYIENDFSIPIIPLLEELLIERRQGETVTAAVDHRIKAGPFSLKFGVNAERATWTYQNQAGIIPADSAFAIIDADKDNLFKYAREILAFYANSEAAWGPATITLGARAELARDQLNSGNWRSRGTVVNPFISVKTKLSSEFNATLIYSTRIDRPTPPDLNPSTIFGNRFVSYRGNPDLDDQNVRSLGLAIAFDSGSVSAKVEPFYRRTRGYIVDDSFFIGPNNLLLTKSNSSFNRSFGVDASLRLKLSDDMTLSASGVIADHHLTYFDIGSVERQRGQVIESGKLGLDYQIGDADRFQFNIGTTGRVLTGQGYRGSVLNLNLAYEKKLNSQLTAVLTVNNPFAWQTGRNVIDTDIVNEIYDRRVRDRTVYLALTWRPGAGTAKAPAINDNLGLGNIDGAPPK